MQGVVLQPVTCGLGYGGSYNYISVKRAGPCQDKEFPARLRLGKTDFPRTHPGSIRGKRAELTLCMASSINVSSVSEVEAKVLCPVQKSEGMQHNALLILSPGMSAPPAIAKKPEEYLPLASAIQDACPLRLWVVVLNHAKFGLSREGTEQACIAVRAQLADMGYSFSLDATANTFFAGHSAGGFLGWPVAMAYASGYINLASNMDCYEDFPKPVLTLSGEMDGQVVVALQSAKYGKTSAAMEETIGEVNMVVRKPVVVVRGMNHGQVSSSPPNYDRGDLNPEIPLEVALSETAALISAWLVLNTLPREHELWESAYGRMCNAVREFQMLYRCLWEAIDEPVDDFVQALQVRVARACGLRRDQVIVNICKSQDCFVYSKPWVDPYRRQVHTYAFQSPQGIYGVTSTLWVKMKRAEAVWRDLGLDCDSAMAVTDAATINRETFDRALSLVSEEQREKYERRGRKLVFQEDVVMGSDRWVPGDVEFRTDEATGIAEVRSPVLWSDVDVPLARFAGMYYMKVLTLGFAMEWILLHSFR